jgi:hypothetical protein
MYEIIKVSLADYDLFRPFHCGLARGRRNLKGPGEKNELSPPNLDTRGFFDFGTKRALDRSLKKKHPKKGQK